LVIVTSHWHYIWWWNSILSDRNKTVWYYRLQS